MSWPLPEKSLFTTEKKYKFSHRLATAHKSTSGEKIFWLCSFARFYTSEFLNVKFLVQLDLSCDVNGKSTIDTNLNSKCRPFTFPRWITFHTFSPWQWWDFDGRIVIFYSSYRDHMWQNNNNETWNYSDLVLTCQSCVVFREHQKSFIHILGSSCKNRRCDVQRILSIKLRCYQCWWCTCLRQWRNRWLFESQIIRLYCVIV